MEREIEEMQAVLDRLPYDEVRRVEASMRDLTLEQMLFVRATLAEVRTEERLPAHRLNCLEHLFDKWWAHGLATKMVAVRHLESLSASGSWPDGVLPGQADLRRAVSTA